MGYARFQLLLLLIIFLFILYICFICIKNNELGIFRILLMTYMALGFNASYNECL